MASAIKLYDRLAMINEGFQAGTLEVPEGKVRGIHNPNVRSKWEGYIYTSQWTKILSRLFQYTFRIASRVAPLVSQKFLT
jgi:hypothetical protein